MLPTMLYCIIYYSDQELGVVSASCFVDAERIAKSLSSEYGKSRMFDGTYFKNGEYL